MLKKKMSGTQMTHSVSMATTRDGRLSLALLLFVVCGVSVLIQAWIVAVYIGAAIAGDWAFFFETFPFAAPPPREIGVYCFDDCSPRLPFVAGWIAISSFLLALSILAYSWWRPKASDS